MNHSMYMYIGRFVT